MLTCAAAEYPRRSRGHADPQTLKQGCGFSEVSNADQGGRSMTGLRAWARTASIGAAIVALVLAAGTSPAAAHSRHILDMRVAFHVKNTNTSALPCPSDG